MLRAGLRRFSAMSKVASINNVDIDPSGTFKYILIKVSDGHSTTDSKLVVRGYGRCGFHADILDEAQENDLNGLRCDCVGGGRIQHDPAAKKLFVYGYSQGYGRANHKLAVALLKEKYSDYDITWSNDGY